MDILAGMLAYVAGIGAVFAALAVAFFVFVATPKAPLQAQSELQSAHAMLARPSASNGPTDAHAKQRARESAKEAATHSEKRRPTAGSPGVAHPTASARDHERKAGASSAQARRLIQEEHDRRWAYQPEPSRDSSFQSRFLGYAD